MDTNQKLSKLRKLMVDNKLDAYLLPRTDPHQSEYLPEHWECVNWLTGFSGSAANVVVTNNFAGVWTDSRYFIQAEEQLSNSSVELMKLKVPHAPEYIDWLVEHLKNDSILGLDNRLISPSKTKLLKHALSKKNIKVRSDLDLIGPLWSDRPSLPSGKVFDHHLHFCGVTRTEKLEKIKQAMQEKQADTHIIASLDDIAWLLNIRGSDSGYTPLLISYLIITNDKVSLFADPKKLSGDLQEELSEDQIWVYPYESFYEHLKTIKQGSRVWIDNSRVSEWIRCGIPESCTLIEDMNLSTSLKGVKNPVEIENVRKAMIKDGIAMTRFSMWLEDHIGKEKITELSAAAKLESFRKKQEDFFSPSFTTISGYKEHGAIVHYSANESSNKELKTEGLFLLDSGAQYLHGTTDITRTFTLGQPTEEEKTDFTLVLKGMIRLSMMKFPEGTAGNQIEVVAREAMWQRGINYGHGTGHGVGFFLSVHEGPQSFGRAATSSPKSVFVPGMITTIEPGIYREGKHGIRTENITVTVKAEETEFGNFIAFETLTLCPIEKSLIVKEMLTSDEIKWLNDYHQKVYDKLSLHLSKEEKEWLKRKTSEI